MIAQPAIVVVGTGLGRPGLLDPGPLLVATLQKVVGLSLPLSVVTTPAWADVARQVVAARDVTVLPDGPPAAQGLGAAVAAAVAWRGQAGGWLVLPGELPQVQPSTLMSLATAIGHHAVAYAQHRGQRGPLVGFSPELYSELVGLRGDDTLDRLMARYPSFGVDVDDPGVLPAAGWRHAASRHLPEERLRSVRRR